MIDINSGDRLFCISYTDGIYFNRKDPYFVKIDSDKLYYLEDSYGDRCYISMDDSGISVNDGTVFFSLRRAIQ